MLGWLKKKLGPTRIVDPVFGELVYMGGYWEGAGRFAPAGCDIEWFVSAPREGPGDAQRSLFRAMEERYSALLPAVHAVLAKHIVEWDPSPSRRPMAELVRLSAISVPERESPTMEWDLSFDSTLQGTPHFAVLMKGWHPTGVDAST